jgi:hypothetical protein
MVEEKKETVRGFKRRFPTHIIISVREGEQTFEVDFSVRPPRLEHLSGLSYFQNPYDTQLKLGLEVITDIRQGDLMTEDGMPIHAGVDGWKEILSKTYPDLVVAVGSQYAHLITGHRLTARDPGFFPMPEPTSEKGLAPVPSAESAPENTADGQKPTAKS